MGGGAKTGADGRVTVEKLSPGYLRCRISAKDHEAWSRTVQIDVGEKLDLGDVRLGPAVKLEGTLVDADGKPVGGADITWAKLDQLGTVMPFATNMHARSEADGSFSISGLGRGLIAIAAASGSNGIQKIARGVFENPPTEPIVMRMVEPARCNFVWPKDPARTFDVMLFDAKRRPVTAVHLMHRSWQAAVTMPPGEYSYEVRDQNHALLKTGTLRLGAQAITLEIP